jgi:Flp pilus assembly protein TadD
MQSSPQIERALLLQQQGRHELAEKELRQHLAGAPSDGLAMALLAISLLEQERRDEAEATARQSIATTPDAAFSHYALARILVDRNRDDEAAVAINEAIRLEPEDADYHGMRAAIEISRRNWPTALTAAETGLQFDAQHVTCNNLRAMALVKLGRKAEAGETLNSTLAREPENAFSHANKGWSLLESGDRKRAMHHFRESLRLEPEDEWAKAGLVEAIKAGNPLYAVMLRYFLWMQKLPDNIRWIIILGGYFGSKLLRGAAKSNPGLQPIVTPLIVAYTIFAVLSWLAQPVFNLLLFLHPFGRHALSDDQRSQARLVGICFALGIGSLAVWIASGRAEDYLYAALVFGLLALPTSAIHACDRGWPRLTMTGITATLALLGLIAVVGLCMDAPDRSLPKALGYGALGLFSIGVFASQWIAIWLMNQRPKR